VPHWLLFAQDPLALARRGHRMGEHAPKNNDAEKR
jgi:hypothetical protein